MRGTTTTSNNNANGNGNSSQLQFKDGVGGSDDHAIGGGAKPGTGSGPSHRSISSNVKHNDSGHDKSSNNYNGYGHNNSLESRNITSLEATSTHDFDQQSPDNYLDSNWASNLFMDPAGNELLYSVNLESNAITPSNNQIMQNIQFQNNIHHNDPNQQPLHSIDIGPNGHSNSHPDGSNSSNHQYPPSSSITNSATASVPTKSTKQRRPCDHCRRKKTKCVIIPNTNNCVQCESKSLTCTYTSPSIKRKATDMDGVGPPLKKKNEKGLDINQPGLTSIHNDQSIIVAPDVPIRDVAPIQDYSVINNSLLKKTLSLQFPRSSFYVGPTSYLYDINLLNLIIDAQNSNNNSKSGVDSNKPSPNSSMGKIEQINLSNSISLRKVSDKAQFVLKDDQSPQSYQTMSNDVDTIEKFIAPHGQILIDLYFRIIHPSYPILHKKVFLEKYSRTHREFSAPLLAAVYVLAIQWWDYDPQLNRFPKPNVELILKIGLNNYFLEILKRPKLSAVQAGLLLLQCKHIIQHARAINNNNNNSMANDPNSPPNNNGNLGLGDTDYSEWVLCSQVIALAEELGLGLDCNNWKLPKWERGLRKRLAWAVYMEDKWLSLKHSRPTHINERNWVVVSLVEEDFPEKHGDGDLKEGSSDIDNGKKIFMNLIELSMILSDLLDQFYSMKAMTDITNVSEVLKIAKPLQLKLRTWYHSLPLELQMSSVQPRKLCSNGYLQLAYFATELTLHRKIASVIYQQSLAGNPPPKELVTVCRAAARTRLLASIEFVRDLKPEHIHSFWHSSSSSNFTLIGTFAAILFMSSPNKEEADFYRDQIFNYRWILKISSKGFDQVGEALMQLDLVLSHIPGLLNDGADLPMVLPNVPNFDFQRSAANHASVPSPAPASAPAPQSNQSKHQRPPQPEPQSQRNGITNTYGGPSPLTYSGNASRQPVQQNRGGGSNPRGRPPQQAQQQQSFRESPYASPQNFATPPVSQGPSGSANSPSMQQTMSRGGQFMINSPQSSTGLSPKEVKQQPRVSVASRNNSRVNEPIESLNSTTTNTHTNNSPNTNRGTGNSNSNSKANSPVLIRSPTNITTNSIISRTDSNYGRE